MAKGDDPSVLRYVWPPKAQGGAGGYVSNDNLAVLNGAENPVLAHMFLNYMLDDKVAIKIVIDRWHEQLKRDAMNVPVNSVDHLDEISVRVSAEFVSKQVIIRRAQAVLDQ